MNKKVIARQKKAKKGRAKIAKSHLPRLSVHRTNRNIYAQIISSDGLKTIASANSLNFDINEVDGGEKRWANTSNQKSDSLTQTAKRKKNVGSIIEAKKVGYLIAVQAKKKGIDRVAFDRSGFKYHGRIKLLADEARKNGIIF